MSRLSQCCFPQRGFLFALIFFMCSLTAVSEEANLEKSKITEGVLFIEALNSEFKVQKIVNLKDAGSFCTYVKVSSKKGLRTFVIKPEGVFEETEKTVLVLIKKFPLDFSSGITTNSLSVSEKDEH